MNKTKKIIALILSSVILLSSLPVFALNEMELILETVNTDLKANLGNNAKNESIKKKLDETTLTPFRGSLLENEAKTELSATNLYDVQSISTDYSEKPEIGSAVIGKVKVNSQNMSQETAVMSEATIMTASLSSSDFESIISPSFKNSVNHPHLSGRNASEYISSFDGTLQLNYTDLYLPGRNGLDLALNRIYKSEHSNVEDSNTGNEYTMSPTTYYNKRFALGLGWSFGFPSVEVREKYDGSLQTFYHDGTGSSYRSNYNDSLKNEAGEDYYNGSLIYCTNLDNYYTDNVRFKEGDRSYTRGEYQSEYSFKTADGTMQYFGEKGQLLSMKDRFGNEITFDYVDLPGENLVPFGSYRQYSLGSYWSATTQQLTFDSSSTSSNAVAKSMYADLNSLEDDYYVSLLYQAADEFAGAFDGTFQVYCDLYNGTTLLDSVLIAEETPTAYDEAVKIEGEFSISDLNLDETPNRARIRIAMVGSKHKIYFTDIRLSPKTPLISKITDTIGRTLVFDYQGDIYERYEGTPSLPIKVTVYDPDGNYINELTYYRNVLAQFVEDTDGTTLECHHFFFFWGCDNGDYSTFVDYEYKDGYGSTIYATNHVDYNYQYFNRPLVNVAKNRHSETYFTYEKVSKWLDNRPRGSAANAVINNTGFIETWRVVSKYDVNNATGDTENSPYNQYTYNYTSGSFDDETGYNQHNRNSKGPGYLDPDIGSYRVIVTNPNGSQETYEYTSHTFDKGFRRKWKVVLPLLDKKSVTESTETGADSIVNEYTYNDNYAIISPNQVKTTETINGTSRSYYTKTEYDSDSCLPVASSLPLTEAESKLADIPVEKSIETVYEVLDNRTFLPKQQKYYQKSGGNQLTETSNYDSLGRVTSTVDAQGNTVYYEYDTKYTWMPSRIYFSDPENTGDNTRIAEVLYEYKDEYGFGATKEKVKYADGDYSVTSCEYEPKYGNVVKSIDPNGNKTTYTYDFLGRATGVSYPSYSAESGTRWLTERYSYDKFIEYDNSEVFRVQQELYSSAASGGTDSLVSYEIGYYDDFGNLLYSKNEAGEEKYFYDSANRVSGYQNWTDYGTATNTLTYTYDGFDRITTATDKMGNVQNATYKSLSNTYTFVPAGGTAENHYVENYDMYGRKISETVYPNGIYDTALTTSYDYDLVGNVVKITDANGKVTQMEYDALNNPVTTIRADGSKVTQEYTKWGSVKTASRYDGEQPYTVSQTFDDRGLVETHRQNGLEIQTKPWYYNYGENGSLAQATTPNGNQRTYAYDDLGNNTTYTVGNLSDAMQYTHVGQLDRITRSRNGEVTDSVDYVYNDKDWLVSKTTGGQTTSYTYNALGNVSSMTSPSGLTRTYTRDTLERVTQVSADNKQFTYEYYGDGLVKKLIYPTADMYTEYLYDNANRLRKMTTYSGSTILKSYVYSYDNVGNIISVAGSENVTYTYDSLYRLKSSTKDGVTTTYAYDSRDNLIAETRPGYNKTYEYGGDNRLYKTTENGVVTQYEYDLNGNLIKRGEDEFAYDANDRLVYSKVDGVVTTYEIGLDGLRKSKTTNGVTTTYQLDENGQVISDSGDEIISGGQPLAKKIDGVYYYYIYNGHGDVVSVVDETGKVHRNFQYDDWGLPQETASVQTMSLDIAETATPIQDTKQYVSDMEWISGSGNRNSPIYGSSDSISVGRITYSKGIACGPRSDTIEIDLNGEYSTFHSVLGVDDEVPSSEGYVIFSVDCVYMDGTSETLYESSTMYSGKHPLTIDLSVEDVDVLKLCMTSRYNDSYNYGDWADAYVIRKEVPTDPANAVYVSDMTWSSSSKAYRNETSEGDVLSIGSIMRNKGIGTSRLSNGTSNVYIPLDGLYSQFVSRIGVDDTTSYSSGSLTFYVYGDGELLYQSDALTGSDTEELINVSVRDVQQLQLQIKGSGYGAWSGAYVLPTSFYEETEDPFEGGTVGGEIVGEVNPDPALDSIRYAGEYYDPETGLIYLRNRYYDPSTRRFTQEDPIRDGTNWYAYCAGNPVNRIDPSGENWKDTLYGIGEAIDQNNFGGLFGKFADWLIKDGGSIDSEYDYYLGRVTGDVISYLIGGGTSAAGIMEILGSIVVGGGITVSSSGTLTAGGMSIIVEGAAAGTATVVYGNATMSMALSNLGDDYAKMKQASNKLSKSQIAEAAKKLGFEKTNHISHGQTVYYNKKTHKYISYDVDGHNGGVWKMADSVEKLANKNTRLGTYDINLNRIGD